MYPTQAAIDSVTTLYKKTYHLGTLAAILLATTPRIVTIAAWLSSPLALQDRHGISMVWAHSRVITSGTATLVVMSLLGIILGNKCLEMLDCPETAIFT